MTSPAPAEKPTDDNNELILQAAELIISTQFASSSMLQRKLRIGHEQAERVMDVLEQHCIWGPAKGADGRTTVYWKAHQVSSAQAVLREALEE